MATTASHSAPTSSSALTPNSAPASAHTPTRPIRPRSPQTRGWRMLVPYLYLLPTITLMLVLLAVPIVMVIHYSLQDAVITNPNPVFVGISNYAAILTHAKFYTALKNTAFFTLVSVIAHMIIGLAFALLLNSDKVSAITRTIFRTLFVLPWLLTVAIIAILWRLLLNPNGVVNYILNTIGLISGQQEWLADPDMALTVVTLINIWAGYPFFMISLLAGLQGISPDLYEAAEVDGAGPIRRFTSITIPQLLPVLTSMALLDIIWTSQQFALIWMTTGGGPLDRTEMLATYTYKLAFSDYDFAAASAAAVLIFIMSMLLAALYVKSQKLRD